jgi:predicted TIM-barrel fold metal-dependent hydrolase
LADPASRERIKTWRRPPFQLGLRFTLIQPHNAQYWTDGTMDWMWAEAEKHCPLVGFYAFSHLDIIAARAARHPGLRIVIDHMGLEGIKKAPDGLSEFAKLLELARLPNVAVKLTGAQAASAEAYPFRDMHEPIRRTIDAFGPERVFWGTDLTRMPCSYRQCVTMFTEEMPWLKGDHLNLVMGEGFMRWARWRPSLAEATPS